MSKLKVRYVDLNNWENVTEFFSEEERHYKDTYLEINEVYDETVEVSLFSSKDKIYEIYFSYGILYGIIYVDEEKAYSKREEVKNELAQEYQKHKEPTSEFVNAFCKKHKVCLPNDILFDASALFDY
jgi:hypothetical protein